jgi:hypothetical protein
MEHIDLLIILILSELRNAESEKKIKGFEALTKVLSMEVDRQRKEIESMKYQRRVVKFNPLRSAA